jgi:Sec-independent protein secretion pathway component TatC
MLAVPMCLLYEIGLVAARFFPKPDADAVAGDDVKA